MGICYFCGKEVELPFRCPYCNLTFCDDHRLPEQHHCIGLPDRSWDTYRLVQRGIRNQSSIKKEVVKKEMKKPPDEDVIALGESMGDYKCALCGEEEGVFYKCLKCGEIYCWKHRKPTWHSCSQRRKKPPLAQEVKKTYTPKARLSRKHIVVIAVFLVSSIVVFSYLSNQEVNNDVESIIGIINELIRTTTNTIYETFLKNITIPKIEFSSSVNHTEIERLILKYTNIERKNKGLKELEWDEKLSEIAREHSIDMVEKNFFNHINLEGETPTDRARRHGYRLHKDLGGGWYTEGVGENIGKMPTGNVVGIGYVGDNADDIAKAQVKSWMESIGHRENMLNEDYDKLGVGVAYDGTYYFSTQNFW